MLPLRLSLCPWRKTVKTLETVKKFLRNEQGAELAEYAVAVALLVAIALVVYKILGDAINDSNTGTAARVGSATWAP
jgi:Flp pilus assembly pilin Flp